MQTRANVHSAQLQTMGHRDRGSDLRRGGAHSRPRPTSVVETTRAKSETRPFAPRLPSTRRQKTTTNSVTELSCTALCVVQPQEEDDKFRDGFVTATRNCYTLPGNGPVPLCNE